MAQLPDNCARTVLMDHEKKLEISPLGWYVPLPEPAEGVLQSRGPGNKEDPSGVLAALAQAYVLLFEGEELRRVLPLLERVDFVHSRLADALLSEDLLRRGELAEAHNRFLRLSRNADAVGAWATLRAAESLERMSRPAEVEELLMQTPAGPNEPALLRAMVTARLRFRQGKVARAVETLEGATRELDLAPPPLIPAYHRTLAICLTLVDKIPRAHLHHRHAVEGFKQLGDRYMLCHEYLSLGQTYLGTSELDHADFYFNKAASLVEALDHAQLEALLCARQGMLALIRGDLDTARDRFQRDLDRCEARSFHHGRAYAQRNLGKVLVRLGEVQQGVELLARSRRDFERCKDLTNQELSRLEEASAMLRLHGADQADEVASRLDRVAAFFTDEERHELAAQVGAVRARLLVRQGKVELALQEMDHTARTLLRYSRPDRVIESLQALAKVLLEEGHEDEAVAQLARAYREAVRANRQRMANKVLLRLGKINEQVLMSLVDEPPMPGVISVATLQAPARLSLESSAPAFHETLELCQQAAPTDEIVLIQGETGAGKGVLATHIHEHSRRARATLLPLNCGAIVEGLLESELFGHERGAFTDAHEERVGVFEAADGGTIFLDEVGELSPSAQVSLLRFLDDGHIRRVGSNKPRKVDVRVVCATNRDLRRRVDEGDFREDLYYRLAVVQVEVPPLRRRMEDLPALVQHFISVSPVAQDKGINGISKAALDQLAAHDWPGNLRELDNTIRAAAVRCRTDRLLRGDLPPALVSGRPDRTHFSTLAEANRRHIEAALELSGGRIGRAADLLGIHRNTLTAKIKKLGIEL